MIKGFVDYMKAPHLGRTCVATFWRRQIYKGSPNSPIHSLPLCVAANHLPNDHAHTPSFTLGPPPPFVFLVAQPTVSPFVLGSSPRYPTALPRLPDGPPRSKPGNTQVNLLCNLIK